MKISICCLTFNHGDKLSEALDSFLMQKGDFEIEVLIHDDASTDHTAGIIHRYQQLYPDIIKPIIQTENQWSKGKKAISATYNFPRAEGNYIAMCEGDDYWTDPMKLQKQIDILERHPEAVACFTNAHYINEIEGTQSDYVRNLTEGFVPDQKLIEIGGSIYPSASLMFRTGCFDYKVIESIPEISGDELLIYTLAAKGKVYFLDEKTCIYRRWIGGVFSSISKDYEKLVAYKLKDNRGYRKFDQLTGGKYADFLRNKISRNSLFIVRHAVKLSVRARHFRYLRMRELIKLLSFRS